MVTRAQREEEFKLIIEPFVEEWLNRAGSHFAAFRNWAVGQVLWDENLSQEEIEEATAVDGQGDMGIDAWYLAEDESPKVLYLIQSKDTKATKDDLHKLKNGFLDLFDPLMSIGANTEIRTRFAELHDKIDDDLAIEIHLVTSRLVSKNLLSPKARDTGLPLLEEDIPIMGRKLHVSSYVHDVEVLASNLRIIREQPITARFTLENREYFKYETASKFLTVSAAIRATELAQLFNRNRINLFRLNPRYYLSAKSKTNKGIEDTLIGTDPDNFYLYNNGLTATGSAVKVRDCSTYSVLEIDDFQIVNGCQTTVTIHRSWGKPGTIDRLEAVRVPIRIIETQSAKQMASQVAQTTNNQNRMKPEDFRSGDDLHMRLQKEFDILTPRWFYEHKRGTWNTDYRTSQSRAPYMGEPYSPRRIQMKDLAQACLAFLERPDEAVDKVALVFSSDKRHSKVFPNNCQAQQLLLPYLLFLKSDSVAKEHSQDHEWSTRYLRYPMVSCVSRVIRNLLSEPSPAYFQTSLVEKLMDSLNQWSDEIFPVAFEELASYVNEVGNLGRGIRAVVRQKDWLSDVYQRVQKGIDHQLKTEAQIALKLNQDPNEIGLRSKFPFPIKVA